MANGKTKKRRRHRPSFLWGVLDSFTASIYSFFTRSRVAQSLSSKNTLCKNSFLARLFRTQNGGNAAAGGMESVVESNAFGRFVSTVQVFLASLKLHVYGFFLTFYGISSALVSYMSHIISGYTKDITYVMITSGIIALCGLPLIFSGSTAAGAISRSRFMRKVVLDFLDVPEEKLNTPKQYGGMEMVFIASIIALVLGILTYFFNPIYVPVAFIVLIVLLLIFSNPETGIILTLASTPILQYFDLAKEALIIMIAITTVSYLLKVVHRRRVISLSPEIVMVMLFCGFIGAAGIFSVGGIQTFLDSMSSIVIILGGFFLTYNLIHSEKEISICTKTLLVSFILQCAVGIWDAFYNGLSNRIIDSVSSHTVTIPQTNIFYIADSGVVFGMFAILVFPMIFAYMTRRKSAKGVFAMIILALVAIISAWMCSNYEIVVAMLIECLIFWLLYSHKSLTVILFAAIPVGIVAILYPYAMAYWNFPNLVEFLAEYMPASVMDATIHNATEQSVIHMIIDGNLCGIGAGEYAFGVLHPAYANSVSVGAVAPTSLWLEILCWSGIFGFVSFAVFVAFLAKRSFTYLTNPYQKAMKGTALATFCGIAVAMLFGSVYSIWNDPRMLYLFWVCTGILMGHVKVGAGQEEKRLAEQMVAYDDASVELIFRK